MITITKEFGRNFGAGAGAGAAVGGATGSADGATADASARASTDTAAGMVTNIAVGLEAGGAEPAVTVGAGAVLHHGQVALRTVLPERVVLPKSG